ncbi:hypothetical protein RB595_005749 [Gaeumannomyces hyphopodioides]
MSATSSLAPKRNLKMVDIVKSRFWSKDKESELRNECPFFATELGETELKAWKMTKLMFGTNIPEIFTYGLRIQPSLGISCDLPASARAKFFELLLYILPHPIFLRDPTRLRFILQMAAFFAVEGHVEPYGPVPHAPSVTNAVYDPRKGKGKGVASPKDGASLALALWRDFGLGQEHIMQLAVDQLQKQAARRKKSEEKLSDETQAPLEGPPEAKQLFFVGTAELVGVISALNNLDGIFIGQCRDFAAKLDQDVGMMLGGWATVAPRDLNHLDRMVVLAALNDERKYRLRKALRAADGEAGRRDMHVFDVPDGDGDPEYAFADGLDPDALRVLAGEVCPRRYPVTCTKSFRDDSGVQVALGQACGSSRDAAGPIITFASPAGSRPASPDFWLLGTAGGDRDRRGPDCGLHEASSSSGGETDGESESDSILLHQFASQVDGENVGELLAGSSKQAKDFSVGGNGKAA